MVFYFRFPLGKNCIFFFLVFRVKNKGKNFDVMHVKKRSINMTRAINYFTFYTKDSTTIHCLKIAKNVSYGNNIPSLCINTDDENLFDDKHS